ncbi:TIGR04197 family type VII secretion effector [Carnobacterium gallinarum]|uniref:TIGR04197 family type VII secretion effector n=1 Tax=Carnobacterium gallinarum TaxID=2749 RepID=UPI00055548E3|nr:TIGR04197 family type VII secretion effector [Carnobacterium gallinarum]
MVGIKSDFGGANQKATALKSATDKLVQSTSVTNDTQTTVLGNANAQEVIQQAQETARQVAEAIISASSNLQSVAEGFQELDQQVGQRFLQSLGGLH